MKKIFNTLKRKFLQNLQENPIFVSLGIISAIGFIVSIYNLYTGVIGINYPSILLGIGLIFESRIRKVLTSYKRKDYMVMKVITFLVGVTILLGGLASIPSMGIIIIGTFWQGMLIFANIIALFVVLLEVFVID